MGINQFKRRHFLSGMSAMGSYLLMKLPLSSYIGLEELGYLEEQDFNFATQGKTWVEVKGQIYGAKPDEAGPIGGGAGYKGLMDRGDVVAEDLDTLILALAAAKPGDVIFIPGHLTIDLTTYVYIDAFVLEIPPGVTLASDRGYNGSQGALLTSAALKTDPLIRILGPDVRLSGLRIQGPNGKRYMDHHAKSFGPGGERHSYYYKFPVSVGVETEFASLEVDNCEISAFSRTAISIKSGGDHHIHHCYIHHCQYNGLGYGISHDRGTSLINYNLFDFNRHSIAGTGRQGSGYVARNNVELGTSLSHCFDMHGGIDRKDGTTIAGAIIEISNNTFNAPQRAIGIRGIPEEYCRIHRNWFLRHAHPDEGIKGLDFARVEASDNVFGKHPIMTQ